jgi:type II secretory pathway component PulJ
MAPPRTPTPPPRRPKTPLTGLRTGFSLTELLVASTLGLIMMAAVASLFSVFSRALSSSQSTVELTGKMRSVAWQLRQDLAGVTVRMRPPVHPESNSGYFELIEGPLRDMNVPPTPPSTNISADTDDILLFTTKAAGGPFVGRYGEQDLVESDTAEVAWFCREAPASQQPVPPPTIKVFNLYRRQLLVLGYAGKKPFLQDPSPPVTTVPPALPAGNFLENLTSPATAIETQQAYDVSLREYWYSFVDPDLDPPQQPVERCDLIPNTLADLTARENRFGHKPRRVDVTNPTRSVDFPYACEPINKLVFYPPAPADPKKRSDRTGEDVILTNVIAFDVRVYDPSARALPGAEISMLPGDPGYAPPSAPGAYGSYIDLGGGPPSAQGGTLADPMAVSPGPRPLSNITYDTWNLGYEFNGIDEDNRLGPDTAGDKKDNNGNGIVDEAAEFETSPPYLVPLRGIEVRLRCYEPTSKQVRQITIRQAFSY